MRAARIAPILAVLALFGCGGRTVAPSSPAVHPPEVVAVSPEPDSRGVAEDPEIWIQFAADLDTTTLDDRHITLFLDTQRIPAALGWEAAERRVRLRPRAPLALGRTHTVRVSADLRARDGAAFGHEWSWQFRIAAVGSPRHPWPADGTVGESPFVALAWDSVRSVAGAVLFDVYAGSDSAAIAARSTTPLGQTARALWLPRATWRTSRTVYWAVSVRDRASGDTMKGPVWRFDTVPASTPIDSVELPPFDWMTYDVSVDTLMCLGPAMYVGGGRFRTALRWSLGELGSRKLAWARLELSRITQGSVQAPRLWGAQTDWAPCDFRAFPEPGADLGGFNSFGYGGYRASADALTSYVEAMMRYGGFHGFVLTGTSQIELRTRASVLRLGFFRAAPEATR